MFHHRQQLINWLFKNVTDRVIKNALESGGVECCGRFDTLPTTNLPGWIVVITGRFKTYNIGIVADNFKLRWFRIKEIPWQNWIGDIAKSDIYRGDNPEKYQELKNGNRNN